MRNINTREHSFFWVAIKIKQTGTDRGKKKARHCICADHPTAGALQPIAWPSKWSYINNTTMDDGSDIILTPEKHQGAIRSSQVFFFGLHNDKRTNWLDQYSKAWTHHDDHQGTSFLIHLTCLLITDHRLSALQNEIKMTGNQFSAQAQLADRLHYRTSPDRSHTTGISQALLWMLSFPLLNRSACSFFTSSPSPSSSNPLPLSWSSFSFLSSSFLKFPTHIASLFISSILSFDSYLLDLSDLWSKCCTDNEDT